jgi:cysteine synthase A
MTLIQAQEPAIADRLKGLAHMVGNTPLVALEFTYRGKPRVLYAKSEQFNLTGSIKDRMALHILERAYAEGRIHPGDTIVEATSGNTGISFAALGRALGHPVVIYMPDWMSRERVDLIHSLGARIVPVGHEQGGFLGSIRLAEEMAAGQEHVFLPHQFSNEANAEAHQRSTGPEIWWQLQHQSLRVNAFVAGVGTGGTIMGVGRFLWHHAPGVQIHPLEPVESPTLSTGYQTGAHRIQGISDEFIPPIVKLETLDNVVSVHDGDAILMAQKLAAHLGLGVGISSGANLIGALMVQNDLGPASVVATVFPDSNKKYLSTDLLREEPAKDDYLTPDVEFTGFRAFRGEYHACCEQFEPGE